MNTVGDWFKDQLTDEVPKPLTAEQKRANHKSIVDEGNGTKSSAEPVGEAEAGLNVAKKPKPAETTSWSIDKKYMK